MSKKDKMISSQKLNSLTLSFVVGLSISLGALKFNKDQLGWGFPLSTTAGNQITHESSFIEMPIHFLQGEVRDASSIINSPMGLGNAVSAQGNAQGEILTEPHQNHLKQSASVAKGSAQWINSIYSDLIGFQNLGTLTQWSVPQQHVNSKSEFIPGAMTPEVWRSLYSPTFGAPYVMENFISQMSQTQLALNAQSQSLFQTLDPFRDSLNHVHQEVQGAKVIVVY